MNLYFPDQCSFRTSLLAPSLDDETEVKTIRTFFQRGGGDLGLQCEECDKLELTKLSR